MKKMKTKVTLLAFAIAGVVAFGMRSEDSVAQQAAPAPQGPPPAPVEVALASSTAIGAVQWVPGTVMSREDSRIASAEPGRVVKIAEVGDRVEAGGVVARLDDEALDLAVRENEAALARIESQLDYQVRQVDRLKQLRSQKSIAETQLDEALSLRDGLEQDKRRAKVALENARRRVREATIRAPFAGVVAERFAQVGEYVQPGATVARLVNTEHLEVQAPAPVAMASRFKAGDVVTLRNGDEQTERKIRAVVPVGNAQSRQLELRIAIEDGALPIGAAVQVALPSGDEPTSDAVVSVPRDALILRNGETFVYKVGADNKAERVDVTTGSSKGTLVEVKGEVAAGDRLIVRGGERLQPGQALAIREG